MVTAIRVYIEGGGSENSTKVQLREGFRHFFRDVYAASRAKRVKLDLILCGSQDDAFQLFALALIKYPNAFNVLLVDSDHPVSTNRLDHVKLHFRHAKKYFDQGWRDLDEEQCHLMVQVMEAWFLADVQALKDFYARGFQTSALPRAVDVEGVDKNVIYKALDHAARKTKFKHYDKILHAKELLALLTPSKVRKALRHCELLFQTLESKIQAAP